MEKVRVELRASRRLATQADFLASRTYISYDEASTCQYESSSACVGVNDVM